MSATPSSVSRALKAGGLAKSTTWATRIKGLSEHSTGFAVQATHDVPGSITVTWKEASISRGRDTSLPNMVEAAKVLRAKGFTVEPSTHQGPAKRAILLVTKPDPS